MSKLLPNFCMVASVLCGLSAPVFAQSNNTALSSSGQPQRELNWAERMFSDMRLEMGTVAKGTEVKKSFTVTNLYKEDITLSGFKTSCGCFTATVVDNKKTLKTHESATFTVAMNTIKYRGERNARLDVTVTFDGSTYKTVSLPLHGFIRTDVEIEPGVLNLGTVEEGRGTTKSVSIRFLGRSGARIQDVRSSNPLIKAEAREKFRDYSQVQYDIVVTLAPDAPLGTVRDMLKIVTNDAANPELEVETYGKVEPDLVLLPSNDFDLKNLRPGVQKTVNVVIRGQRPFKIEKLERDTAVDCWISKYSKEARTVHPITLTMTPPDVPGEYHETFTISVSGRPEPLTVKVSAMIISPTATEEEKSATTEVAKPAVTDSN
jgi:hypothetical protein